MRRQLILETIIKEHIKTAAPVGSSVLVEKYKIKASPATVRNDMMHLEEEGYIIQPYTSAGRIPTEKAYRLHLLGLKPKKLTEQEASLIHRAWTEGGEGRFKAMAKTLAQLSSVAVFWAIHQNNLFYTGLTNLLQQPEFAQQEIIYDISAIIDQMDEIVGQIYHQVNLDTQVLIGSQNPFGSLCSAILTKYQQGGQVGLFGILGPMRMDYAHNLALVNFTKTLVHNP